MTLSVREVLRLAGETAVAWAIFDPAWYSETYGETREDEPEEALRFYLDRGQSLGHAPNRFFDERWYLRRYPAVAARVQNGDFESGFDHYCRAGFASHSPHWLYSEALYREQAVDLTDGLLEASQLANRYDHYLQHGSREGWIAHRLFDPTYYLARLADEAARVAARAGPFADYLGRLSARRPEIATSVYFDPIWYRTRYAEALATASEQTWLGALLHYLCNDMPGAFDPVPLFSETWYRQRYQDIDAVCAEWRAPQRIRSFPLPRRP
jgi:O-antigen biosynthesis protein